MRRFGWAALALLLWPAGAQAECAGTDLLAELAAADPAAHSALFAAARAAPNGQGKFWRVSRDGAAPSFLYGTFHDTGIARDPLDPAVAEALAGARLMLVELTGAEEARMQARMARDPGFALAPQSTGLLARLSPAERAETEAWLAGRGIPAAVADRLRAWMLFSLLSVPDCMFREAIRGQPMLDSMLQATAAEAGIPVAGLERYEDALAAMEAIPAGLREAMLLAMLRERSEEEDVRTTVTRLYRAGEIAAIREFGMRQTAATSGPALAAAMFAAIDAKVIAARNQAWMATLVPEMARGGVFAAFGSLHLPGPEGVIELLRARGFEVTRLDG